MTSARWFRDNHKELSSVVPKVRKSDNVRHVYIQKLCGCHWLSGARESNILCHVSNRLITSSLSSWITRYPRWNSCVRRYQRPTWGRDGNTCRSRPGINMRSGPRSNIPIRDPLSRLRNEKSQISLYEFNGFMHSYVDQGYEISDISLNLEQR